MSYYAPTYEANSFTCPHCNVYSQMEWRYWNASPGQAFMKRAECIVCNRPSYWFSTYEGELEGKLVYPLTSSVPIPHPDMPDAAKADYLEAREVLPYSSRAAAALIRLALQRLCIGLGKSPKIDRAIGELVQDGLPQGVQRALDAIRIIGNESVHPGEIQDADIDKSVGAMFELLNYIVQDRITRFKEIDALYESLPESKRQGVEQRDAQK